MDCVRMGATSSKDLQLETQSIFFLCRAYWIQTLMRMTKIKNASGFQLQVFAHARIALQSKQLCVVSWRYIQRRSTEPSFNISRMLGHNCACKMRMRRYCCFGHIGVYRSGDQAVSTIFKPKVDRCIKSALFANLVICN